MGAFGYLFPEICGGPLDTTRQMSVLFVKWVRILLNRRDPSWRKYGVFLFCAAAVIFRYEALCNVQFKLRGKVRRCGRKIAGVKSSGLMSMAADLQQGKCIRTASSEHPEIFTLLRTLQTISPDSGKHKTRTDATSMVMQLREPFFG